MFQQYGLDARMTREQPHEFRAAVSAESYDPRSNHGIIIHSYE
jgi:hypothetical protein